VATEIGATEPNLVGDALLGRLAKMPHVPKPKRAANVGKKKPGKKPG